MRDFYTRFNHFFFQPIVVFLLVSVAILPVILLYPFSRDNNLYQWMGLVLFRYHGLPYLASWDQNFPGIVVVHALSILLFGNSIVSFRLLEYIWMCFTLFAIFQTSRLWISETASLLGCVLFALFYIHGPTDAIQGQRDFFAILPLSYASYAFAKSCRTKEKRSQYLLACVGGLMVGMATCIRPTFALLLVAPILTVFRVHKRFGRMSLLAFAGFVVPIALTLLPFALQPEGLHQFYLATIRFNADVYSPIPPTARRLSIYFHDWLTLHVLLVIILSAIWLTAFLLNRWRKRACIVSAKEEQAFLGVFFLMMLLGMFSMQALANYHFLPFYALFMPVLAQLFLERIAWLKRWKPLAIAVMLSGAILVLYPWGLVRSFVSSGFSLTSAYAYATTSRQESSQEAIAVASYIQLHSKADDFIAVMDDPGVSWRMNRKLVSRFPSLWQFVGRTPFVCFTAYQQQWRQTYLADLMRTYPQMLVIYRFYPDSIRSQFDPYLKSLPEISAYIDQEYTLDTVFYSHAIYRRK